MATSKEVRHLPQGWQWRVFFGRDTDRNGRPLPGTADAIRGGWAATKARAHELAGQAIEERGG